MRFFLKSSAESDVLKLLRLSSCLLVCFQKNLQCKPICEYIYPNQCHIMKMWPLFKGVATPSWWGRYRLGKHRATATYHSKSAHKSPQAGGSLWTRNLESGFIWIFSMHVRCAAQHRFHTKQSSGTRMHHLLSTSMLPPAHAVVAVAMPWPPSNMMALTTVCEISTRNYFQRQFCGSFSKASLEKVIRQHTQIRATEIQYWEWAELKCWWINDCNSWSIFCPSYIITHDALT